MQQRHWFVLKSGIGLLTLTLFACGDDDGSTHESSDAGSVEAGVSTDPASAVDAAAPTLDASSSTSVAPRPEAGSVSSDAAASGSPLDDGAVESGQSDAAPQPTAAEGYLLVAELAEGREAIHAYRLPDLQSTGRVDNVKLGSHLGAIALPDGRIIISDDKNQQILALRIDEAGALSVVNRVSADLGTGGVWGCGDEQLRYLAIASGREGSVSQVANIVKLDDFTLTPFEVSMNVVNGASEELHPAIAGNPLHLFAGVGAEIRAYPLDAVLAKSVTAPVASVMIHPGAHGPLVSHDRGLLYIAAAAGTGFDGVTTKAPFDRAQLIPWDVGGRTTGRNARPRLSVDGRYVYGAIARTEPAGAELWAMREVDLQSVDLETLMPKRVPLTTGIVSKFQLSKDYALFANVTSTADYAILVDVQPSASTFQQVAAKIELPRLANGPVAGQPTTGKEARGSAITPDGKWAFVSHGGEGKVSVIDTSKKAVVGTVQTPTSLTGGGHLFAFRAGARNADTCMR